MFLTLDHCLDVISSQETHFRGATEFIMWGRITHHLQELRKKEKLQIVQSTQ